MEKNLVLPFVNPATGEQFGEVPMATPQEVFQARQELKVAFARWSHKPVQERVRILRKFQELLIDSLDPITAILTQDCGKSRQDALIEAFITADVLREYLKRAPGWLRRHAVSSSLYFMKQCYVEWRPYGVVGVIAPWNYPLALSLPSVLAALLAGNTVMLKPSEVTGATGVLIENLFEMVPELSPYVKVLHGDSSVGAALVQSAPDYLFLTGSTLTGKRVSQAAGEHLIPLAMELGGKDAMLVLEDADIAQAALWGTWGAYFNAGQTCMAVERVYVVEEVYDRFVELAVAQTNKLQAGYTTDLKSPYYLGPITDVRQVKIIERHLEDALAKGARVLCGGGREGMFFEPTVLVEVDHSMLVMHDETFGPLMPIMKVKDEAEAIRMANDNPFGLGASIWSGDLERAQRVAHQLEAASILINDTIAQFAVPMLPFGGIKESGYGRTHGKEGLMQFTRPYSYAVSNPPVAWDIATLARQPGNYELVSAIMHIVFGVNMRQRVQPLARQLMKLPLQRRKAAIGLGLALSALGLMSLRKKRRANR